MKSKLSHLSENGLKWDKFVNCIKDKYPIPKGESGCFELADWNYNPTVERGMYAKAALLERKL